MDDQQPMTLNIDIDKKRRKRGGCSTPRVTYMVTDINITITIDK